MPLLPDIFRWLIDTSAAGAVLLMAAWGVMSLLKQPARRLRVGELALAGCLVLAIVQAIPATRISLGLVEVGRPAALPWFDDSASARANETGVRGTAAPASGSTGLAAPTAGRAGSGFKIYHVARYWREALLCVYGGGVLWMGLRLLAAWLAIRRLSRRAEEPSAELGAEWLTLTRKDGRRVRLVVSRELGRPLTFGLRRPVVVLPASLLGASREDLQAVLRHELGHVERRDAGAWVLAAVVNLILFFVPALWLVKRQMRLAQEFLADQVAADAAPSRAAYAEMMLRLVALAQGGGRMKGSLNLLTVQGWHGSSDLMIRMRHLFSVRHLLERKPSRGWTLVAALMVVMLTAGLGAFTLADHSMASKVRARELEGVRFLMASQRSDGGWLTDIGPAPTALVVRSLLQAGVPANHPAMVRARHYVDSCLQSDGGYYTDGEPTYHTAVVLSMYAAFDDADARARIAAGRKFLDRELTAAKPAASGWYHRDSTGSGDSWAGVKFADPRDRAADAVLDSYGSLTYARWKSLVYAGLTPSDPRVQQTSRWLAEHWTLEKHPGTNSAEGLYYYYLVAAKTLRAAAADRVPGQDGRGHAWREELQQRLLSVQSADGSWTNTGSPRWLEDRPEMVTAYALLALQETRK